MIPRRPAVPRPVLPDWYWRRCEERVLREMQERMEQARALHGWTPPEAFPPSPEDLSDI